MAEKLMVSEHLIKELNITPKEREAAKRGSPMLASVIITPPDEWSEDQKFKAELVDGLSEKEIGEIVQRERAGLATYDND